MVHRVSFLCEQSHNHGRASLYASQSAHRLMLGAGRIATNLLLSSTTTTVFTCKRLYPPPLYPPMYMKCEQIRTRGCLLSLREPVVTATAVHD